MRAGCGRRRCFSEARAAAGRNSWDHARRLARGTADGVYPSGVGVEVGAGAAGEAGGERFDVEVGSLVELAGVLGG
jgi:hypothetical protein